MNRIGAFEIQMCRDGNPIPEIVFSKLNTQKWPDIDLDILNGIPRHQSLTVQFLLQDNEDDEEEVD